jgi:hypothetical protein
MDLSAPKVEGDPPDMVEVAKATFRKEGAAAKTAAAPVESNPYAVGSMARALWLEGYEGA